MQVTRRVAVLSPFVGGDYYGAIIAGVNHAATAEGWEVVGVQTLDPGSNGADYCGVPELRFPVGWRHFAAAVVLPGGIDAVHADALQRCGRPVVAVSYDLPGIACPTVCADNRTGIREAVTHLVGHGHRRIAFAGNLAVRDVRERYEAYLDVLAEHGLEAAPDLLLRLPDNHESGGVVAAAALLDAGMPATAIVLGTDRNALGLCGRLLAAGVRLPQELAVVGFDDIAEARYAVPSLSSVRQPLERLGAVAFELALAAVADPGLTTTRTIPARFVRRDSCGCPATRMELSEAQARRQFEENRFLQQTLNTQYELGMELLRSHEQDPRTMTWMRRTPARAGCLALWPAGPGKDSDGASDGPGAGAPAEGAGGGPLVAGEADGADAGGEQSSPQAGCSAHVAAVCPPVCPAMRSVDDPAIEVVGSFRRDEAGAGAWTPRAALRVSAFPPSGLFDEADGRAGEIVFVVPVRSRTQDWGYLAAVGRIQDTTPPGRETMNHAGSLLAVALDHDVTLRSLQEQQERLRQAALHDQLTGLPNRTLLMDRLTRAAYRAGRRSDHVVALLFLDLNGFKAVNDTLGHAAGDHLLVHVAERLTGVLRRTDTAARLGGDEFVVLLDGDAPDEAARLTVERIHAALAEPVDIDGHPVRVSASIGVARAAAGELDADDLLRRADSAMYRAKAGALRHAEG